MTMSRRWPPVARLTLMRIRPISVCPHTSKDCTIHNTRFYDAGSGICHQVMIEEHLVTPGTVVVGSDSHSTMYGCVGAFGTGMGSTDVAVAMATGQTWLRVPATLRVDAVGELPPGVGAKDVALQLAGRLGAAGARYMAVEFGFPETLELPARMTLCGMTTEIGAKAGLVVPDAVTATYATPALKDRTGALARPSGRVSVPDWLYPDPGAVYARRERPGTCPWTWSSSARAPTGAWPTCMPRRTCYVGAASTRGPACWSCRPRTPS